MDGHFKNCLSSLPLRSRKRKLLIDVTIALFIQKYLPVALMCQVLRAGSECHQVHATDTWETGKTQARARSAQ